MEQRSQAWFDARKGRGSRPASSPTSCRSWHGGRTRRPPAGSTYLNHLVSPSAVQRRAVRELIAEAPMPMRGIALKQDEATSARRYCNSRPTSTVKDASAWSRTDSANARAPISAMVRRRTGWSGSEVPPAPPLHPHGSYPTIRPPITAGRCWGNCGCRIACGATCVSIRSPPLPLYITRVTRDARKRSTILGERASTRYRR